MARAWTPSRTSLDSLGHALAEGTQAFPVSAAREGFPDFVARVRAQVDACLMPWLQSRLADARPIGPDVEAVADAICRLALRGGKRMRPALLAAAFEACGGQGGSAAVMPACIALELLQAYLLAHDDWMDGDETRRGGPSVPAMMRARFVGPRCDAMSVLAGDLAAAWARRALLDLDLPSGQVILAAAEMARVEEEVVQGQILDVCEAARDSAEVETMHALKTASYSIRGPVVMGAHLAGASASQVSALARFAGPLGVAFQLRDDLLGIFGDPAAMGKPIGSDLRRGKRSAVWVEAVHDPAANEPFFRVLGCAEATDEQVRAAVSGLDESGVRARVEARIEALARVARLALDQAVFEPRGRVLLAEAVAVLTCRQS